MITDLRSQMLTTCEVLNFVKIVFTKYTPVLHISEICSFIFLDAALNACMSFNI